MLGFLGLAAVISASSPEAAELVGPPALLLGNGAAGAIITRRARSFAGRERLAWVLMGSGLLIAASGVIVLGAVAVVTGSAPAFGPTDLIFITAYAAVLTGFASLPHVPSEWPQRARLLSDGLIGSISLGAILWVTFLADFLHQLEGATFWGRVIGTAYPGLDVAMLVMVMIVVIRRSSFRFDLRLVLFGVALTLQAVADISFLLSGVGKTFQEANPNFPVFILASMCFLGTGLLLHRRPRPREYADRQTSWWAMLAPYSAAAILIALLIRRLGAITLPVGTQLLFYSAIVVGLLVVVRQTVAIRENRALVEHQRSALVSSISHELRTPLTAMVGFLSLLSDDEEGLPEAERQEIIEVVHAQATYMARIVSDLVMLARGTPETIHLEEAEVSVADLVETAVTSVETGLGTLTIDVPPDLRARLDPDRIQQVLVNLISNATRYGGPERLVLARLEGGRDLVFEVHDDGPGVPRKYELAIWDRFERGANRLNASVAGSGIGLAVVDAIVRAHRGVATYRRSEVLGGACFALVLPGRARLRRGMSSVPPEEDDAHQDFAAQKS